MDNLNSQEDEIKNNDNLNHDVSSEDLFKELYDDLFETYQIVFEHIRKVDILIDKKYLDSQ